MASRALVEIVIRARDSASRVLEGIAVSSEHLNIALGAIGVAGIGLATSMTLTAARTEELGVVTENLGRAHGYTAREIQFTEERIKALGITTQAARLLTAQLIGSQVGLARAIDIARAAQDLAVLGMTDSSEAASDLAYAIASLQPRLLRKYRIYISLVDVYRKAATELGKHVTALTHAEKMQAFQNAVLVKAAQYTGTYEAAMTTAGKQLRSMRRYVEEMANEFGEHLLPVMNLVIRATTDLIKTLTGLPDPIQATLIYTTALGGAFLVLTGSLALMIPKLMLAIETFTGITTATTALGLLGLGPLPAIIAGVVLAVGALYLKTVQMNMAFEASRDAIIAQIGLFGDAEQAAWDYYNALSFVDKAVLALTMRGGAWRYEKEQQIKQWQKEEMWLPLIIKEWNQYNKVIRAVPGSLEGMNRMYKELGQTIAAHRGAVQALSQTMLINLTMAFTDAERATEQYHGNVLTMERRKAYLQEQLTKKGYDDALVAEIEGINKQIHEAERGQREMERIFRRQIAMMAVTALQQILPPMEALRAGIELLGQAEIISPAALGAGRGVIGGLAQVQTGQITGMEFAERAGGILAPTPAGAPTGGVSIAIGNLYGTDRVAATKFGQQIGRDLLSLGVRTR